MTICVGLLCKDGVVLASDTMFSDQILGFNNKKLYKGNNFICGISGAENWAKILFHKFSIENWLIEGKDPYTSLFILSNSLKNEVISLNPGIQNNINSFLVEGKTPNLIELSSIIGFYINDKFYLAFFVSGLFSPVIIKEDEKIFHSIIGSGYTTSAPLVNLLIDILDIKDKPDIKQGKLLAYWLVRYAIDNASMFVGGNVEILSMTKMANGGSLKISEENDCKEYEDMRKDILDYFRSYFSKEGDSDKRIAIPKV